MRMRKAIAAALIGFGVSVTMAVTASAYADEAVSNGTDANVVRTYNEDISAEAPSAGDTAPDAGGEEKEHACGMRHRACHGGMPEIPFDPQVDAWRPVPRN
jgi:hypothetical protein